MNIVSSMEKRSGFFWAITGIVLIVGIGAVDLLTGYEIAFSLFYLVPIFLVTYFGGKRLGFVASIVCAVAWLIADLASGHPYSHPAIYLWNTLIRFGFFIIVALLLTALKEAHQHEQELARIDDLTGAYNARFFSQLLQLEIDRFHRYKHPFTLAYIDLDNFKAVNDHLGHRIGDKVLYTIIKQAKSQLRKVDIVARLGGDEFAFLLPETDQAAAQVAISKIQKDLMDEMRRNDWPVTFSIGVVTCTNLLQASDEIMRQADNLMYSVKNNGKNGISYSIYTG